MRVAAGKTVDSRAFDKKAMEAGIPSLILMENAAFSLFLEIKKVLDCRSPEKIVVLSGRGGNGGDGFALLRILADRVPEIPLFLVEAAEFKEADKIPENSAWMNRLMVPEKVQGIDFKDVSGKVLFVDAMLGTGLKSEISGKIKESVEFINSYPADKKFVVSVDVPTGLDCDTGAVLGEAVKADLTVTM
ncbi:NAD(P)H-hydrate epimerase, partial [bacterium]|nr:NAD(P)H-hydrate epimerase [bacterium]